MEGREEEEKGPTSKGQDRNGRETGRERKGEREKKGRGAACPNNKQPFPLPWPVSINVVNSKTKNLNSKARTTESKSFRLPFQVQRLEMSVVFVVDRILHCTVHTDHLN